MTAALFGRHPTCRELSMRIHIGLVSPFQGSLGMVIARPRVPLRSTRGLPISLLHSSGRFREHFGNRPPGLRPSRVKPQPLNRVQGRQKDVSSTALAKEEACPPPDSYIMVLS